MNKLKKFHEKYIKDTKAKAVVADVKISFCRLTRIVQQELSIDSKNVYITSRALKHLYDQKPSEEYDVILRKTFFLVRYPEEIYKNKGTKRGDFCFVKNFGGERYICSLEIIKEISLKIKSLCFVTCFRDRKKNYLKNYRLIWSWKGDNPSS